VGGHELDLQGSSAIDDADPPPEKYFDTREDPLPVAIPDLSRLLPGTQFVSEDDLGEFSLGAVLALHLGDTEGLRAALGWRGDRYRIWEDAAGASPSPTA